MLWFCERDFWFLGLVIVRAYLSHVVVKWVDDLFIQPPCQVLRLTCAHIAPPVLLDRNCVRINREFFALSVLLYDHKSFETFSVTIQIVKYHPAGVNEKQ